MGYMGDMERPVSLRLVAGEEEEEERELFHNMRTKTNLQRFMQNSAVPIDKSQIRWNGRKRLANVA